MINGFDNVIALEAHIKNGGVISSPRNVTSRYRADLLRLMESFVDSEFAASAGFASILNEAPGIVQRINVARIILEKAESGEAVLNIMADFGIDIHQYGNNHPDRSNFDWSNRLERDGDMSALPYNLRDMRLSVFYYPFKNWCDAMMMGVLMGKAKQIQLQVLSQISYAPLADAFRTISTIEQRHTNLARDELLRLAKGASKNGTSDELKSLFHYWLPKVRAIFGSVNSSGFERLKKYGLRYRSNKEMLDEFNLRAEELRQSLRIITGL